MEQVDKSHYRIPMQPVILPLLPRPTDPIFACALGGAWAKTNGATFTKQTQFPIEAVDRPQKADSRIVSWQHMNYTNDNSIMLK